MTTSVFARAYAKINWGLELIGRRDDGYHEIVTLTHTVSLADGVTVGPLDKGPRLETGGQWPVPAGAQNLCWRAAIAYADALGVAPSLHIRLDKQIPPAAGLGGGSSDAVAVLLAAERILGGGTEGLVGRLAAELGSDTVLFLHGGAAVCSGRGEIVTPISCPRRYHLVLARPDVDVSTREAYAAIGSQDFTDGGLTRELASRLAAGASPGELAPHSCNAFVRAVFERYPQIRDVAESLQSAGAPLVRMTGSGSAVFAVFATAARAAEVASDLSGHGTWAVAAHTLEHGVQLDATIGESR